MYTTKQKEFAQNATKMWNVKIGAVRSGKTYVDQRNTIARRVQERLGLDGLAVIIGVTQSTIERNILTPMRKIYGKDRVGFILKSDNTVKLFGETVHVLGAEKSSQESKFFGMSMKYLYIDEFPKIHKDVFNFVKSRLDCECSVADLTGNPDSPNHWAKEFIDTETDLYYQHYVLDDNAQNLPARFVDNLKRQYEGTFLYDRLILGKWMVAEGLIFPTFANNPEKWILTDIPYNLSHIQIGVDFGGFRSATAFVATGFRENKEIFILEDERIATEKGTLDPAELENRFLQFVYNVSKKYNAPITTVYGDSAEQYLVNGIRRKLHENGIRVDVWDAKKRRTKSRIECKNALINTNRWHVMSWCENVINSTRSQAWDGKKAEDTRLDNGTSDIDTADAEEYSWENMLNQFMSWSEIV